MKVVSIVGMTGAGKSEVSRVFEENGFIRIRFGDLTDEGMKKRNLEPSEGNERYIRELLRQEHGMATYAKLNLPRIEQALNPSQGEGQDVVIDGLYSWEEYTYLKGRYGEDLYLVAVWSSPKTRYARLSNRSSRRLTLDEAISRDRAELGNINKGGPIAMADFTIINESSLEKLQREARKVISTLR
jgi:dephospho-CoA kinase